MGDPLKTLLRTFDPKLSRYSPDGFGRDRYIAIDNGGLLPTNLPSVTARRNLVFTNFQVRKPSPRLDPTAFKYVSDGSGRDYYIT